MAGGPSVMKLRLLGALAALMMPTAALAANEPLPDDDWDRGVACAGYLVTVTIVLMEQREEDGAGDDDLINLLDTSFGWWSNHLAERPDYSAERYKTELTAFMGEMVGPEGADSEVWMSNIDACIGEAKYYGMVDPRPDAETGVED